MRTTPGLGQHVVVLDEQKVDHQADDFARREVLSRRLVRQLRELPDQLLEDVAHLLISDLVGMEVDVRELLCDLIEELRLRQPLDLGEEIEPLEDVPDRRRERLDVGEQVLPDVVLVADQLPHVHRRGVVEGLPGLPEEEGFRVHARLFLGGVLGQDGVLGGLQDAIETA